jgi:hypothetical protein
LHHPPNLVAALRPRVRKENVNIIRARVGQSTKGISAVTVKDRCVFKPKLKHLFSRPFDTLPLPLHTEKVREGIPSRHLDKKTSVMTSHINLKRPGTGSPPIVGKQIRRRFGERCECPLYGLEVRHAL